MEKDKRFFLETEQGLPYANVFKALRLNHLVNQPHFPNYLPLEMCDHHCLKKLESPSPIVLLK